MLAQRANPSSTRGEQVAKLRMTRTMGVAMFAFAFASGLYLPALLLKLPIEHPFFKVCFLVVLMLNMPVVYNMMSVVVQRKEYALYWNSALGFPFFVLAACQLMASPESDILIHIGAAFSILCLIFLLVWFADGYSTYLYRLQSEYSETTRREIFWSWFCFTGFALQGVVFVAYQLLWSFPLELFYIAISVFNAAFLCFCICRQRTIDLDALPEKNSEVKAEDKHYDKSFYASIEEKLSMLIEENMLFLNPDLTLETLSMRLAINRTYLGMYFRSREITFYQYINTLRVEYAYKLMLAHPDLSIREISEQSGFRSQTTFRKVFQEVKGCLPSDVKREGASNL